MGLLEQVIGGVLGSQSGNVGRSSPIVMALTALLAGRNGSGGLGGLGSLLGNNGGGAGAGSSGALGGLLEALAQAGHGGVAQSWIGNEANQRIAPDQLGDALGGNAVGELSRHTGLPNNELLSQLAQYLPAIVDRLTPDGRVPTHTETSRW